MLPKRDATNVSYWPSLERSGVTLEGELLCLARQYRGAAHF